MSQCEPHGFNLYWYLNEIVINKIIVVEEFSLVHFLLSINKGKQDLASFPGAVVEDFCCQCHL
jgi:hypothetical protein